MFTIYITTRWERYHSKKKTQFIDRFTKTVGILPAVMKIPSFVCCMSLRVSSAGAWFSSKVVRNASWRFGSAVVVLLLLLPFALL